MSTSARLEGYAREQLARGRGEWSVVHELVRMSRIEPSAAQAIVRTVWTRMRVTARRRGLTPILLGALLLTVPMTPVVFFLTGAAPMSIVDLGKVLLALPVLLPLLLGTALVLTGARRWRHSKATAPETAAEPDLGPVRTGLWWRADPFEWK